VVVKSSIFWDITPCSRLKVNRRFGGTCRLHLGYYFLVGRDWVHLVLRPLLAPDDRLWWLWNSWTNEDWQGKPKYSEKTCPNACPPRIPNHQTLSSNPGRRVGKPATKRLSYGTVLQSGFLLLLFFNPEDGGNMFLRNVGWFSAGSTALYPRR
jgi:hypothetical protein